MRNWNEINENIILNYEEAQPGMVARYERIMSKRLRDSVISLTESFNKQTNELKKSLDNFNDTSTKLSSRLCWLNGILVFLTIILVIFGIPSVIWQIRHWQ